MNLAGDQDSAAALIATLEEVASLLEAGDSEGASLAMAQVVGRCPSVSAQSLGAEGISAARRLLDRCRTAQLELRKKLSEEMGQMGASRKAAAAYER
jgi:hypothetical protein